MWPRAQYPGGGSGLLRKKGRGGRIASVAAGRTSYHPVMKTSGITAALPAQDLGRAKYDSSHSLADLGVVTFRESRMRWWYQAERAWWRRRQASQWVAAPGGG